MGSIIALATDPMGRVLYSCGADSFIKYWDIKTGKILKVVLTNLGQGYMYSTQHIYTTLWFRTSIPTVRPSCLCTSTTD